MSTDNQLFAIAKGCVPLFNTPDIASLFGGNDGQTIPFKEGMLKELEMIALPKTAFVINKLPKNSNIVGVSTIEYLPDILFWTDKRLLFITEQKPSERERHLPPLSTIIERMQSLLGMPYLWGGNTLPIRDMLELYPPSIDTSYLKPLTLQHWNLEGVDCSGLLYFATDGFTPRNTSELIHFGKPICVEGKKREDFGLKAGDLILWKGHVIIVISENRVIESLGGKGVIITSLSQRLNEIETILQREPQNEWPCDPSLAKRSYVIRRFHPEA